MRARADQDVLELQHAVGNRAVAQLLATQEDHRLSPVQRDQTATTAPRLALTGSVGRRADNHPADVRAVQNRLVELGFVRAADRATEAPPLAAEGKVADRDIPLTILAIRAFQRERAYLAGDGRIDVGAKGKTLAALNGDQEVLDNSVKRVAGSITGMFEARGPDTLNTYDKGIVSYGKHQATLAAGSLYLILKRFCENSTSDDATKLTAYLDRVKRKDRSLQHNKAFHKLLKDVAFEGAMLEAQEHVFREEYWKPSQRTAAKLEIKTPLGRAFFYDCQIQGGGGGLNRLIRGATQKVGGVPDEVVGGRKVTEQEFVLAMIDYRGEHLRRVSASHRKEAESAADEAATLEAQAATLEAAGDAPAAKKARRAAAGKRSKSKRLAANSRALLQSANKTRVPMWRALAESGDWQLTGGTGGFLIVKGAPVVGRRAGGGAPVTGPVSGEREEGSGSQPDRDTSTEVTNGGRSSNSGTGAATDGTTPAGPAPLLAALAAAAGSSVAMILDLARSLGMGDVASRSLAGMEEDLTDLIFALRHPELLGRRIRKEERALAREWIAIRDGIVRHLLSAGAAQVARDDAGAKARPTVDIPRPAPPVVTDEKLRQQIEAATRQGQSGGKAVRAKMARDLSNSGTDAQTWFTGIVPNAMFLDVPIAASSGPVAGVHRELLERLKIAENTLLERHAGVSKADLARQLNVYSISGLRRPKLATGGRSISMHCYGMAVDINYKGNPFVGLRGKKGKPSYEVIRRATQLVLGEQINVGAEAGDRTAGEMWTVFHRASDAFRDYFRLADDPDALAKRIASIGDDRSVEQWQQIIRADHALLNRKGDFVRRDPAAGFMDLSRDLVEALVSAGLYWGGMYRRAKDLMHFDYRGGTLQRKY